MATNKYFNRSQTQGISNEQGIIEDLIIESIQIYGMDFMYIPRTIVDLDNILGEDRVSKFESAYPIECYLETFDAFGGEQAFIDKFGLMMQQTATLTMARKRWDNLIGINQDSILPNRPAEGDLLYFPLTKGLFEIMYVEDKNPFYQVGKLYTYKLQIELFNYSAESIDTGIDAIDTFETEQSLDDSINDIPDDPKNFGKNTKFDEESSGLIFDNDNPFNEE